MTVPRYDVVVVGARVAGASLAMLLARAGLQVLALDRCSFPSDTLSSHQVQVPGAALLARWGVLDDLVAAGTPAADAARVDLDGLVLEGPLPTVDGVHAVYSPRRTLLDSALVEAARAAGAEVREGVAVERLVVEAGCVVGVVARAGRAPSTVLRARLVVGADGKRSLVARHVRARRYGQRRTATVAAYGYWSGLHLGSTARMYQRRGLALAAFPTDDDLGVVFVSRPATAFEELRRDVPAGVLAAADRCDDLGQRLRSGTRVERIRMAPYLPHAMTQQHGAGWALVGDAGAVVDPVTAQGITHALKDAQRVADAVIVAMQGLEPLDTQLDRAWRERDAAVRPVADGTARVARLRGLTRPERALLSELTGSPQGVSAFLASFSGTAPWPDAISPWGAVRHVGPRGVARAVGRVLGLPPRPTGTGDRQDPAPRSATAGVRPVAGPESL